MIPIKTIKEILKQVTSEPGGAYYNGLEYDGAASSIEEAMDIYAKQQAIAFKIWCDENEGAQGYGAGRSLSNEDLYKMFDSPSIFEQQKSK